MGVKRAIVPLAIVAALIAVAVAGYWLKRPPDAIAFTCAEPREGCVFSHAGAPVTLRFSHTPAPLEAFELTIEAADARHVSAEFQMVGMDMGFNRYDLRPTVAGFSARVTLPVCVSGRHDWLLYLDIDGRRYALPFRSR